MLKEIIKSLLAALLPQKSNWAWVGVGGLLCRRDSTWGRLDVVEIIETATPRTRGHFTDVYRPGAMALPADWQQRLGEDLQWYVPAGTSINVKRDMEADANLIIGVSTAYRLTCQVYDAGILVGQDSMHLVNIRVRPDVMDPEVEPIAARLLSGLLHAHPEQPLAA